MPKFSQRSLDNLRQADPRLQVLFQEVIKVTDCAVICGFRNEHDQEAAYKAGKSHAHFGQSPHNFTPSYAVDVIPHPVDWDDIQRFVDLSAVVKDIANTLNINITWGGAWRSLKDYPHYEIWSWETEMRDEQPEEIKVEKKSWLCYIIQTLRRVFANNKGDQHGK